jgi:hypothetical protein
VMSGIVFVRRLALAAGLATLVGCAHQPAPLYMWGSFPQQQYDILLRSGASPDAQMQAMQVQAEKATAANKALPPGFRAHLGMLELNAGHAQRAKELFAAEKAAFPESAPYMDKLLGKLDSRTRPARTETPA